MTRARDISKIVTDANLSGTLEVTKGASGATANAAADELVLQNSGDAGLSILSPNANNSQILLGSPVTNAGGIIRWTGDDNAVKIGTNNTGGTLRFHVGGFSEVMRISSAGNVGIGTSSTADVKLTLFSGFPGTAGQLKLGFDSNSFFQIGRNDIAGAGGGNFQIKPNGGTSIFDITSGGNVGIGTSSPDGLLTLLTANSSTPRLRLQHPTNNADATIDTYSDGSGTYLTIGTNVYQANGTLTKFDSAKAAALSYYDPSGLILFYNGAGGSSISERMRIDTNGNLLVGKSNQTANVAGTEIEGSGTIVSTRDNNTNMFLNRKTSDGDIIEFRKDNTTVGSIGTSSSGSDFFRVVGSRNYFDTGVGNTGLRYYEGLSTVYPFDTDTSNARDNAIDLGLSNARFDDIYATNGTIQTSDRNEKQDIEELSEAEQRVAVVAKGLMRKFRWIDSVAEKGDNARTHFGIIAQDLQDAFTAEGLDASKYAMFTSNTWWEKEISVDAVEADEENGIEAKDAYTYMDTKDEATEGYTEKTRLGVRYNQLLAFIISAI